MNTKKELYGLTIRIQHRSEYNSWHAMKHRCTDEKMTRYYAYGGRGITVYDAWLHPQYGFSNFLNDMGCKPSSEYSLDRIDNNGNYEPTNCRWATIEQQAKNTRPKSEAKPSVHLSKMSYTYKGETKTWKEWSQHFGIYSWRTTLDKYNIGLSFEDALGITGRSKQGRKPKGDV